MVDHEEEAINAYWLMLADNYTAALCWCGHRRDLHGYHGCRPANVLPDGARGECCCNDFEAPDSSALPATEKGPND